MSCSTCPRWENIVHSTKVLHTNNAIRSILQFESKTNPSKKLISLSVGDPTVFGNLEYPPQIEENMKKIVQSQQFNGYSHSAGHAKSRASVAKYMSNKFQYSEKDVFLTSGGTQAIGITIDYLLNPGDNMLIPKPGFPLFESLLLASGMESNIYPLLPENNWEIDLEYMKSCINSKTKAILVNNPSNPCGSNYSKEHLQAIVDIAREKQIPIISDEVYDKVVFNGEFHKLCDIANDVPVFTIGSISKQFILPGWRLGWVHVHDPKNRLGNVREGLEKLTTLTLGPCTLVQALLPHLLFETPDSYFTNYNEHLQQNSQIISKLCQGINGISVTGMPCAALYMLIAIDISKFKPESGIVDDFSFMEKLMEEESVQILPGKAFKIPNHFRITISGSSMAYEEAFSRIKEFCERHKL